LVILRIKKLLDGGRIGLALGLLGACGTEEAQGERQI
jgi:hypothetical protein